MLLQDRVERLQLRVRWLGRYTGCKAGTQAWREGERDGRREGVSISWRPGQST